MAPRPIWWHTLQAGKKEALLAVDLYNRSSAERTLEGFVVHMHLAWLYVLHARFQRDRIDFRYRQPDGRRLVRIDGEPKTWELARSLLEEFPNEQEPRRLNIEFFIRLRNKIEHRYEELIATAVAGKTQALMLNFEEFLVGRFGNKEGLADSLRFPVFMSSLTPNAVEVLKRAHRQLPKRISRFIREYDASLPEEVQSHWQYDFRVILLAQTGPKTEADAVMRFVREEDLTDEQRNARDVVQTIIRTRQVPVQNKGKYKPGAVSKKVEDALGVRFLPSDHHARAWQHYGVRPPSDADRPDVTDERYCVWDEPHGDHLYTDAWVRKLIKELGDSAAFEKVTGKPPQRLAKTSPRKPA